MKYWFFVAVIYFNDTRRRIQIETSIDESISPFPLNVKYGMSRILGEIRDKFEESKLKEYGFGNSFTAQIINQCEITEAVFNEYRSQNMKDTVIPLF